VSDYSETYDRLYNQLWHSYMKRKGFEYDGYSAPELTPSPQSDQVKCLLEIVAELSDRVRVLEDLRRLDSGVSPTTIAKERFGIR
jgi:hypothetical protein